MGYDGVDPKIVRKFVFKILLVFYTLPYLATHSLSGKDGSAASKKGGKKSGNDKSPSCATVDVDDDEGNSSGKGVEDKKIPEEDVNASIGMLIAICCLYLD